MARTFGLALLLTAAFVAQAANAQSGTDGGLRGTRLDVIATGEVTRVPDIARINAGVVTQAPTATAAIEQNARRMAAVRAALRRAGIADRDIQTSNVSLNPDYRYVENQSPQLVGYRAGNEVTVRFRDIANTGRILDALVAQGANQINGPILGLDKPGAALDEVRTTELRTAQARVDLYARAMNKRVRRILSVSEAGLGYQPMPRPMMAEARGAADMAQTKIDPGEQIVSISLTVSYELE